MKKILQISLLITLFSFAIPAFGQQAEIYLKAVAAGMDNGDDCQNAHAFTWVSTPANYGTDASDYNAGTTLHVCPGTYTLAAGVTTQFAFQGNGTMANPIVLSIDDGVIIEAPYYDNHLISVLLDNWIIIEGDLDGDGLKGLIRATDNGSPILGFTYQQSFDLIRLDGDDNIIRNLRLSGTYVHAQCAGAGCDTAVTRNLHFDIEENGNRNQIYGMEIDNTPTAISLKGDDSRAHSNRIYDVDHGIQCGPDTNETQYIYKNWISDFYKWDTGDANQYHHDGIHCFGDATDTSNTIWIYDNRIDGDWGNCCVTAGIYIEGGTSGWTSTTTPGTYNIFNNIVIMNQIGNGGIIAGYGTGNQVLNNTVLRTTGTTGTCIQAGGINIEVYNNICGGYDILFYGGSVDDNGTITAIDGQVYGHDSSGSNDPYSAKAATATATSLVNWRTTCDAQYSINCEDNSVETSLAAVIPEISYIDTGVTNAFVGAGIGTDLTSKCTGDMTSLCTTHSNPLYLLPGDNEARPNGMAWDAGALTGSVFIVDIDDVSCSDVGNGSYATPFCGLEASDGAAGAGDRVITLCGGDYTADSTFFLDASGVSGNPIVWTTEPACIDKDATNKPILFGMNADGESFFHFIGFEITDNYNSAQPGINVTSATDFYIEGLYIHDTDFIAIRCSAFDTISAKRGVFNNIKVENIGISYITDPAEGRTKGFQCWMEDGGLMQVFDIQHTEDAVLTFGGPWITRNIYVHDIYQTEAAGGDGGSSHPDAWQSFCTGNVVESWEFVLHEAWIIDIIDGTDGHAFLSNGNSTCTSQYLILRYHTIQAVQSTLYHFDDNPTTGMWENIHEYHTSIKDVQEGTALGIQHTGGGVDSNINNSYLNVETGNATPDGMTTAMDLHQCNLYHHDFQSPTWSATVTGETGAVIDQDPNYADPDNNNFAPLLGSPLIDNGCPITTVDATDSGSGKTLIVDEAGALQDGWTGNLDPTQYDIYVAADFIAIGSITNIHKIVSINYATNTITLATDPGSRNTGDSVWICSDSNGNIRCNGTTPDIGAIEYDASTPVFNPFTNVQVN